MDKFFKKLESYAIKYSMQGIENMPYFTYGEENYLHPEIALDIFALYKQVDIIQNLYSKEEDYNRLLRQENQSLKEELDYIYCNDDGNDIEDEDEIEENIISLKNKEYVS